MLYCIKEYLLMSDYPSFRQVEKNTIFLELFDLLSNSELHKFYNLSMLEHNFFESINSKQFTLFKSQTGRATGFVNWTFLTESQFHKVLLAKGIVPFDCWCPKGDILFFPEFIAPYGNAKLLINFLRNNMFADYQAFAINGKESELISPNKTLRFSGVRAKHLKWNRRVEDIVLAFNQSKL